MKPTEKDYYEEEVVTYDDLAGVLNCGQVGATDDLSTIPLDKIFDMPHPVDEAWNPWTDQNYNSQSKRQTLEDEYYEWRQVWRQW